MLEIYPRLYYLYDMSFVHLVGIAWLLLCCFPAVTASASSGQMKFFSCTDYHCDTGKMVSLTPSQWQSIRNLFTGDASPAEERENIRHAIASFENMVGAITGTWRDLAGNFAGAGQPGQLDCISESKNTSTYLQLMYDDGLFKWHEVEERAVRHPFIFNTHWTAVIADRSNGERFAVDSWFRDNGQPPDIQPLADWLKGRKMEEQSAASYAADTLSPSAQ